MSTAAGTFDHTVAHPAGVRLARPLGPRNRLTTAFRLILAVPHILLVGSPVALASAPAWASVHWSGGGVLGLVAGICSLVAWFAILFTREYPPALRGLVVFYLRWRVRAMAYTALLRDEYPPFGDEPYPAELELHDTGAPRDRMAVAFRLLLALPHLLVLALLGFAWCLATVAAWVMILLTGEHPEGLYAFSAGMLRWTIRVEAYLFLLHDEYPPFSLE